MERDFPLEKGHIHPISILIDDTVRIFSELGFDAVDGDEVVTEHYNFDVLNIPADHPARDMQDTFWLKTPRGEERRLPRTHTSSVQVKYMEDMKKAGKEPPFAIIVPGKVFRYEATDATHETQFHQVEGMMIGKDVSLALMKGILESFFSEILGGNLKVRFRPSFFPFTEPSVEVDVSCFKCSGNGCSVCKRTGWIEVMGAGMVHPQVLRNGGVDPEKWQGFAFGGGIDRLAMLKWGIEDVRLLYNGDLRVVNQF